MMATSPFFVYQDISDNQIVCKKKVLSFLYSLNKHFITSYNTLSNIILKYKAIVFFAMRLLFDVLSVIV